MGLDCSHDAFHGAYSAFNRLRQFVCAATGGSFPPHWIHGPTGEILKDDNGSTRYRTDIPANYFQCGDDFHRDEWPGLYEFLAHSDCDGEILPSMCVMVADDLERLMPKMKALHWESHGHIATRGGFIEVVKKFIAGCRAAAAANEPLDFH
jgi:hypothetical protein